MKISIHNISGAPVTLPSPYRGLLPAGEQVIVADTEANVLANLGGAASVSGILRLSEVPDVQGSSDLPDPTDSTASSSRAGLFSAADKVRLDGQLATTARLFSLGAPAAAGVAAHAPVLATAANLFPGPFTNPAVPRSLDVAFDDLWDGGNVVASGTDQFDAAVSETFVAVPNSTVVGLKTFKTVTSASKTAIGAAAVNATLQTGDKIGVAYPVASSLGVLWADDVSEAATISVANSNVLSTTAPNGAVAFKLLLNLTA